MKTRTIIVLLFALCAAGIAQETNAPSVERVRPMAPSLQLIFKFTGGGLVSKTGENVEGFKIAGSERKFFPAKAKIIGETLRLTSDDVKVPVAARYDWGTNSTATLFGKNGLPVAPFRTAEWDNDGK